MTDFLEAKLLLLMGHWLSLRVKGFNGLWISGTNRSVNTNFFFYVKWKFPWNCRELVTWNENFHGIVKNFLLTKAALFFSLNLATIIHQHQHAANQSSAKQQWSRSKLMACQRKGCLLSFQSTALPLWWQCSKAEKYLCISGIILINSNQSLQTNQ